MSLDPKRTVTMEFATEAEAHAFTEELEQSGVPVALGDPTSGSVMWVSAGSTSGVDPRPVVDYDPPDGY